MDSTSAVVRNISKEAQDDEYTPLQKHAAFFDRNNDGIVYPWETFQGCRAIGCGYALSTFTAFFFNTGLSGKTRPGKLPNPLLPIEIKNIHLGKHGSDTDAYDNEGRFVPSKFEEIFKNHAHTYPDALTADELNELLKANREPKDFAGCSDGRPYIFLPRTRMVCCTRTELGLFLMEPCSNSWKRKTQLPKRKCNLHYDHIDLNKTELCSYRDLDRVSSASGREVAWVGSFIIGT